MGEHMNRRRILYSIIVAVLLGLCIGSCIATSIILYSSVLGIVLIGVHGFAIGVLLRILTYKYRDLVGRKKDFYTKNILFGAIIGMFIYMMIYRYVVMDCSIASELAVPFVILWGLWVVLPFTVKHIEEKREKKEEKTGRKQGVSIIDTVLMAVVIVYIAGLFMMGYTIELWVLFHSESYLDKLLSFWGMFSIVFYGFIIYYRAEIGKNAFMKRVINIVLGAMLITMQVLYAKGVLELESICPDAHLSIAEKVFAIVIGITFPVIPLVLTKTRK